MTDDIFNLFDKQEQEALRAAVARAESQTSGEIRLHLEDRCKAMVLDRAAFLFEKLQMHETERRNGVLFYLAYKDHKFAILGDAGINAVVPKYFWDDIRDTMKVHFKAGRFLEALVWGIEEAGKQLSQHFPRQANDANELPDDISFG